MIKQITITLFILLFSACSMKPNLDLRDDELISSSFKDYEKSDEKKFNKLDTISFLKDENLKKIVNMALQNNKDLNIALLKIESAKALYGIETSKLFPKIDANGSLIKEKQNSNISDNYNANVTASFELDIFGKNQSLNEAAKSSFFATKYAYNSTKLLLISQTISSYLKLASSLENLKLSKELLKNLEEVYSLVDKKYKLGVASKDEMLNSFAIYKEMENRNLEFENELERDINAIELLISSNFPASLFPHDFLQTSYLGDLNYQIESNILLLRPDIKESEFKLREKNANIGVARAMFFPSISLTASTGYASDSLSGLFSNQNSFWRFSPSINLPIFTAGENIKRLEYSKKEQEIALKEYEISIQNAFKEVNDVLIVSKNISKKLDNHTLLLNALEESYNISLKSYNLGQKSYLNMLITQKEFIDSKINHTKIYLEELENKISLFKVLGGELDE